MIDPVLQKSVQAPTNLSVEQRGFAVRFIQDYNKAATAADLKISPATVNKYLLDPDVLQYIQYLQDRAGVKKLLQRDFFDKAYLRILEACMGDEEVPMVLATGEQIYRRKFDATGARGALQDLAKSNGYIQENAKPRSDVTVIINTGAMNGTAPAVDIELERG